MRINKYLAACGAASRRGADRLIDEGRVTVDGVAAERGTQVPEGADVRVDGTAVRLPDEKTYLIYNKPRGVICTEDQNSRNNIIAAVGYPGRVTYAGRLDVASEGLMLLTDDGDLIQAVMRAGDVHEKEYEVRVKPEIGDADLAGLEAGVFLADLDRRTRPCRIRRTGKDSFRIILTEGINRQIRRMCEAFGYEVRNLRRIRLMNLELGELAPGTWRHLTAEERKELLAAAGCARGDRSYILQKEQS